MLIICYENFLCVIFRVFSGACPLFDIIKIFILLRVPPFASPPPPAIVHSYSPTPTLPPFSVAISNIQYVETFQINFLNISVCQRTDSWNEVLCFVSAGSTMFTSLKNCSLRHTVVFLEFEVISLQTIQINLLSTNYENIRLLPTVSDTILFVTNSSH
jgi:hypothetical protein